MEAFLFILVGITLIMVIILKNDLTSKLNSLQGKIDLLMEELKRTRSVKEFQEQKIEKPAASPERIFDHKTPPIKIQVIKEEEKIAPEPIKNEVRKVPESKQEEVKKAFETIVYPEAIPPAPKAKPLYTPKPPQPGFFERNPDLEKFIGENLANKIGIGILVLGIGFFVKYAIDQEWINEIGRVFIGILCGGILLGVAHRLRKTFTGFSSVLVGGGIAVLYLTIAIAFQEYKIFNQTAAFLLMLVITGFAVLLSLGYNRIELAILSILGGFASPFMVSTGEGNYVILFTYILILNVGMLVLAYYKKWNLVNIISYIFTVLLFGSWLSTRFDGENVSMIWGALLFATLFYLVFFCMNIVNNIKERTAFKGIEISLLLSNTFLFYSAGMIILNNEMGEDFKGLFTASLGIFNFVFAFILYRNSRVDKNLVFLLIGLVLTFISLAAPVQLKGNYITLFWAAETVLLLWLSQKSGIRLMKLASVLLMALMIISLIMDWEQIYFNSGDYTLTALLNKGYITSLVALGSIGFTYFLLQKEDKENQETVQLYKHILTLAGVILLYTSQLLELRYQLYQYGMQLNTQNIIIGSYNMLFILGLVIVERKLIKEVFAFWGVFAMVTYLLFYHHEIVSNRNGFLLHGASAVGFSFHYLFITLLIVISALTLPKIQALTDFNKRTYNLYSWFYVFFFVFLASAELDHSVLFIAGANNESMSHILKQNHKIGFPILWGITSFLLIAIGLKMKKKHLRIISLTLFLITLLKLFLVDIRGISEGGKIAAFISLGILLLVVSFMYQRLKKILLADETSKDINQNPA